MGNKPLARKSYGSIGHLPDSRMGPADHHVHEGQARICCEQVRDRHDMIHVQEKLDGSCVSVAKVDGEIVALGRAGYLASSSPHRQHHLFAEWVGEQAHRFSHLLREGERVVGEWLAQAHGTRYELRHEPFVAFDLMTGGERLPYGVFVTRAQYVELVTPRLIYSGWLAYPLARALSEIKTSGHGALDPVEGVVYRVERRGRVDFLAKYVRPDKVDGFYLPGAPGSQATEEVWNWRPFLGDLDAS